MSGALILKVSQYLSKATISLFAGGSLYCSLIEHPARLQLSTRTAVAHWVPSFWRAATVHAMYAGIATVASLTAYFAGDKDPKWLVAAAAMFAIFPYTYFVMMPVNRVLFDPQLDPDSAEAKSSLEKWGCRQGVRAVLSAATMLLVLCDCPYLK